MTYSDIDFNLHSSIKVIHRDLATYGWRGTVIAMPEYDKEAHTFKEDFCTCRITDLKTGNTVEAKLLLTDIANIQKKFIDIEHIRENDVDLGEGVKRLSNTQAFEKGDLIQITEKIDGANASICYDPDSDKLEVFSRTNLLTEADGLRGFKTYIDTKPGLAAFMKDYPFFVVFGEWCVSHKCKYEKSWYNQWRVYDIWDKRLKTYLPQEAVKEFCKLANLEYIHVLFEGLFVSWDHCRTFLDKKTYGGIEQEGLVVKNQSKLMDDSIRAPKYLKIVNEAFKESMNKKPKDVDPELQKELAEATALVESIVTEARVHKFIMKLVDAGILAADLKPKDMATVAKHLPKGIYEDCLKEEAEVMAKAGVHAGKLCASIAMSLARNLLCGK